MHKLLLNSVAALAVLAAPVPLLAQAGAARGAAPSVSPQHGTGMSSDQQSAYDAWPADRQTTYDAWTPDYQAYYWTLEPVQQEAYFTLDDAQRAQLSQMSDAQRAESWGGIMAQAQSHQSHSTAPATPAQTSSANPAQSSAGAGRTGTSPIDGGVTNETGSSTADPTTAARTTTPEP